MKIKYSKTKDPFSDYMQHQLLGRSLIYLDSLSYFLDFEDTIPLIDYRGNNCGSISIKIKRERWIQVLNKKHFNNWSQKNKQSLK